ncbi:hypothetical protein AB4323_22645, partial [Vibrio sp. 10N.261.52.C11]
MRVNTSRYDKNIGKGSQLKNWRLNERFNKAAQERQENFGTLRARVLGVRRYFQRRLATLYLCSRLGAEIRIQGYSFFNIIYINLL